MAEETKEIKRGWWSRKSISAKVGFIIALILAAICIFAFIVIMDIRRYIGNEIADLVYGPGVSTGWERFGIALTNSVGSWILTALIIFLTFLVIFVCNFITHLFDNGTRKAKTVSSLVRSLVKYISIIAAICFILISWGVDVAGVVAGVGVLTLIIGLGCQTLIQDVISGLFIVFDDYFASGDMVIIDGFRGTIVEVGLKSTKLQDFGGNIKSITNSTITTVVNMSRMRSVVTIKLPISYNEDLERVEAHILNECKRLPEKVPNIIEGPWYKGVDSIGESSVNLLVIAFTLEDNRFQVTRDLNREFYLLFKKHNILIPYQQITVNPQDEVERKHASEEQKEAATKNQNILRGIEGKKAKKKVSVKAMVKESLDKTRKDLE